MSRRTVLAISPSLDRLRPMVQSLEKAGAEVDAIRSVGAIDSEKIGAGRFISIYIMDNRFNYLFLIIRQMVFLIRISFINEVGPIL